MGNRGQTLVEVVVAVAIATVVITALALASTNSIRNAQFSKNQSQATKFAQESLEHLRAYRDRYGFDALRKCVTPPGNYLEIQTIDVPPTFDTKTSCYFTAKSSGQKFETIYTRFVEVTEQNRDTLNVSAWVDWADAQGAHRMGSQVKTTFTRWKF